MAALQHVRSLICRGRIEYKVSNAARNMCVLNSGRTDCFQSWSMSSTSTRHQKSASVKYFTLAPITIQSHIQALSQPSRLYNTTVPRPDNAESTVTPQARNKTSKEDTQCPSYCRPFDPVLVENLLKSMSCDMPISEMPDPFVKDYRRCFLCRYSIEFDHKNVRLLSQFVSPYTGRIYGRAITGLCIPMQKNVAKLIKRARRSGFMPFILKDPRYLHDPLPYDVMSKTQS